jgi:hypothetical protein
MLWDIGQLRQRVTIRRKSRTEIFVFKLPDRYAIRQLRTKKKQTAIMLSFSVKAKKSCASLHSVLCAYVRFD